MNKLNNKDRGFSIIEVVLVLAIAALIMLMVFIAWPALQRSQRDNARKQDAQTVASALGSYKGNNSGKMPTNATSGAGSFADFKTSYISDTGQIDSSKITSISTSGITSSSTISGLTNDSMIVNIGYKCDGSVNARGGAVWVQLEAGNGAKFCVDA